MCLLYTFKYIKIIKEMKMSACEAGPVMVISPCIGISDMTPDTGHEAP